MWSQFKWQNSKIEDMQYGYQVRWLRTYVWGHSASGKVFHYQVVNSTTLSTPSYHTSHLLKLLRISPWSTSTRGLSPCLWARLNPTLRANLCSVASSSSTVFVSLQSRSKTFKPQTLNSPRVDVCDRQCPSKVISLWSASLTRSRALRILAKEGLNKRDELLRSKLLLL